MSTKEVDLPLAVEVMHDTNTAAFIYASMGLGNALRILVELGRPEHEIRAAMNMALANAIESFGPRAPLGHG